MSSDGEIQGSDVELIAYRLDARTDDEDLWAAPIKRDWMEAAPSKFASRCLPLLIANQSGWLLINTETVRLTWDGGGALDSVRVEFDEDVETPMVVSHFGLGIVTWQLPYLFRTSPGWNLLVRGPANCPKDGVYALDGVVETDWATATFTMNWQLTRPGLTVTFARGEPYAMVVPQRRGDLERVAPKIRNIGSSGDVAASYQRWRDSRDEFLSRHPDHNQGPDWQRDYFRGREVAGPEHADEHQTRLHIRDFVDEG
jgi:hypothetical protein